MSEGQDAPAVVHAGRLHTLDRLRDLGLRVLR